jgi:xylose isomerase
MDTSFLTACGLVGQAEVYAFAAAQVKKAMEVSKRLGASAYVFWGGREGYQSLINTDMRRELAHMAQFLHDAHAYKTRLGFNGTLLLEPKPQEPTKHQYDWDVSTTAGFLQRNGLADMYKINVECNHATLAGHRHASICVVFLS